MLFPIKRAEVQRGGGEQRAYREYDQRDHAAAQSQLGVGQQIVDVPQAHPEKLRDGRGVECPQQQGEQPEQKDGKIRRGCFSPFYQRTAVKRGVPCRRFFGDGRMLGRGACGGALPGTGFFFKRIAAFVAELCRDLGAETAGGALFILRVPLAAGGAKLSFKLLPAEWTNMHNTPPFQKAVNVFSLLISKEKG